MNADYSSGLFEEMGTGKFYIQSMKSVYIQSNFLLRCPATSLAAWPSG